MSKHFERLNQAPALSPGRAPTLCAVMALTGVMVMGSAAIARPSQPSSSSTAEKVGLQTPPPAARAPHLGNASPAGWQPWNSTTVAMQVVGGAGGAVVGFGVGALAGAAAFTAGNSSGSWDGLVGAIFGGFAGGVVGMGTGTWAAGELTGGDGSLGWTLAGSVAGLIGGMAAGEAIARDPMGLLIGGGLLGIAGGIVGYNLTAHPAAPGPLSGAMRVGMDGSVQAGIPLALPYTGADGKVTGWQLSLVAGRF
ncbi:MAG: hypothetical protein KC502_18310 [Myxococcales bacterium]|nr:hypothetical protein [Myxococcales bacterium]